MYFAKASISVLLATAILIIGCEKQNSPPVADFTFTPLIGNTDTIFTFDASVSGITSTSAQSGGEITDDGGSAVTERGCIWSTETNPTVNSHRTTDGSGRGAFESSLTELAPNTTYYLWAYAVNGVGTGYGNRVSFKTKK